MDSQAPSEPNTLIPPEWLNSMLIHYLASTIGRLLKVEANLTVGSIKMPGAIGFLDAGRGLWLFRIKKSITESAHTRLFDWLSAGWGRALLVTVEHEAAMSFQNLFGQHDHLAASSFGEQFIEGVAEPRIKVGVGLAERAGDGFVDRRPQSIRAEIVIGQRAVQFRAGGDKLISGTWLTDVINQVGDRIPQPALDFIIKLGRPRHDDVGGDPL